MRSATASQSAKLRRSTSFALRATGAGAGTSTATSFPSPLAANSSFSSSAPHELLTRAVARSYGSLVYYSPPRSWTSIASRSSTKLKTRPTIEHRCSCRDISSTDSGNEAKVHVNVEGNTEFPRSYAPYAPRFTRAFSTSSNARAQSLPDDSWEGNGNEYDPFKFQYHHSPPVTPSDSLARPPHLPPDRRKVSDSGSTPNNDAGPSRQQFSGDPSRSRSTGRSWKGKQSRKGKERAPSTFYPNQDQAVNARAKYQDGPELIQEYFEPTPEDIEHLFRSSFGVGLGIDEESIPGFEGLPNWADEMVFDENTYGADGEDGGAGAGWDLPQEVLDEMGLNDPLPPMPPQDELPSSSSRTSINPNLNDVDPCPAREHQQPFTQAPPSYSHASSSNSTSRSSTPLRTYPATSPTHLPALPAPAYPPDGKSRYDWRSRALSQQARTRDKWGQWFPDLPKRKSAPWGKLTMGDAGRDELDKYQRHFIPLLAAEQAEEERLFNHRIAEWDLTRLQREGYALDEMRGTKGYQPKSLVGVGVAYSFVKGKGERELPFNRFTVGANVIISRTAPNVDPALWSASQDAGNSTPKPLIGSVWNAAKGSLRIMLHEEIPDLERGSWRLDIGCNDFAIKRQIEAIKSLNLDPFQQDMSGFANTSDNSPAPVQAEPLQPFVEGQVETASSPAKPPNKEQTILRGTALRDLVFRAFQADFASTESISAAANSGHINHVNHFEPHVLPSDHIVADPTELRPSDLDAVPQPLVPALKVAEGILARNQLIQSWTSRYRQPGEPIRVEGDPVVPLNESQTRAIAMMLGERLSLVQGPPGTGKTRVIIEAIKLLKKHWQIPHPILVTAHTNVAVDNLLVGLRGHGIKALRFGSINRVAEDCGEFTLDRAMGLHPRWFQLENAKKEREVLFEKKNRGQLNGEELKRLNKLSGRIWMIRQSITREILLDADVICTTCLSATSNTLQGIDFPIVFLDEASMATEPLSLVPLTKGSSHVAIIGDHKQLPPVIISPEAHAGGLATSLFERLIHEGNIPSIMLDTQYRMHPLLSSFPSRTFYSSLLKDGTDPSHRLAPETEFLVPNAPSASMAATSGESTPSESQTAQIGEDEQWAMGGRRNLTFLNHDHPESPISRSLANYGDAEIVCDVIADLLYKNPDLKGSQIGLITPYLSQIRLLSNHLADPERRSAYVDVLGVDRAREIEEIEIKTVDGFEGREKEVIIFSCVRSNAPGFIGFLSDWRRVNVGLTRARRALIMVGSKSTLMKARVGKNGEELLPSGGAKVWRDLMGWLDAEGMIMDVE